MAGNKITTHKIQITNKFQITNLNLKDLFEILFIH